MKLAGHQNFKLTHWWVSPLAQVIKPDGNLTFTSDYATIAQGSLGSRLRSDEQRSFKMGVNTTAGALIGQGFINPIGEKGHMSRFSLVLLNQNDHYGTGNYENITASILFRGAVADITLGVGMHTLWWTAPTHAPPYGSNDTSLVEI